MTLPARLILASTSPYRRMLLGRLGLEFSVEGPGLEETHAAHEPPSDRSVRLATGKAWAVAQRHPQAVVVGSDQVASAGGSILDKPGDAAAARAQLAALSGATAIFHTACAVVRPDERFSAVHVDTTRVVFRPLTTREIERYVARDQPFDCAGGFKAEALGISLFERIDSSDPTGLIGLPLIWLAATLRRVGYDVP